jgi:HSP20 family protein
MPGVKPEDVKVTVEGDTLTIRGTYQHPADRAESGYVLQELREGEFCRSLTLPGEIRPEGVQAKFEDGLLRVSVLRSEAQKPRQIEVKVT